MGFLDEIKNKMHLGGQQGYDQGYGQDDDYGYDDGYDDGYQNNGYSGASGEGFYTQDEPSNGLLGQTRRGEAESVAVYTRSGQLVGDDSRHATTYNPPSRSQDSVASGYRPGAYDTPSSYAENTRARAAAAPAPAPSDASAYASNIINATPQLPAYVLRPESYDDVETVVRRVRTKQPVALIFVGVRTEVAKRVLDFSYGFACGDGPGTVNEELNSGPGSGKDYPLHRLVRIVFRTFSLRKEKGCVMRSGRVIWNTLLILVSGSADPVRLAVGSGPLCRGQFC